MKVIIDADACPVKDIAVRICKEFAKPVYLVFDLSHVFNDDYAQLVQVDTGKNSVDITIESMVDEKDIVITQDLELAQLCLNKKAKVINPFGELFSEYSIQYFILEKEHQEKLRRTGRRCRTPKKRKTRNDEIFKKKFIELLNSI
ncbi:DUF188 domain-containing protein [Candidatus Dependentiae bacterium]|nr:DUF188 domain-containing protein [Candidatus Dependentiae bacterium]